MVYIEGMATLPTTPLHADPVGDETSFDSRRFWLAIGAGLAMLTFAGAWLWLQFGAAIFFDMLAAMQGCF